MAVKYLKDGEAFGPAHFDKSFGFTGSAQGRHDPREHPQPPNEEYGDGLAKGGRPKHFQIGGAAGPAAAPMQAAGAQQPLTGPSAALPGRPQQAMPGARVVPQTIPSDLAAKAAMGAFKIGQSAGLRAGTGHPATIPALGRTQPAMAPRPTPAVAEGGHITAAERHALPASEFGLPGEHYPLDTKARARSALSRASANATPAQQKTIRAKVHREYPSIGESKG